MMDAALMFLMVAAVVIGVLVAVYRGRGLLDLISDILVLPPLDADDRLRPEDEDYEEDEGLEQSLRDPSNSEDAPA